MSGPADPDPTGPDPAGPDLAGPDPFGTAALRRAVLDAWAASPARFREDANAEEDLLRGGYRDRWFVELAQNAADAAARAGTPTALSVTAVDGELRVAAHGAPLDAAGVAALASLRASAKRDAASVGRFGVGFAAVTAISDAPRLVTRRRDGTVAGVAFDRDRTAAAVRGLGGDAATELDRRSGAAPALRLVWPTGPDEPAPAATTEVRLPLRDPGEAEALLATAREQAGDLLLALPGLAAVDVAGDVLRRADTGDGRVVIGDATWRVVRAEGELPEELRDGLAVEERDRTRWAATWAAREDPDPLAARSGEDVLHAPTPTAEATGLPARLLVDVPLDPDRRHVRAGAVTTHILTAAAAAYPRLLAASDPDRRLDLVPRPGLPRSEVDAVLRDAVVDALAGAAWLPAARDGDLVPRRAAVIDVDGDGPGGRALTAVLADVLTDLADPAAAAGRHATALAALGLTRLRPGELVDRLAGLDRPAAWWRPVYAALDAAGVAGRDPDALAALPVPLADGRTVLGPRGTLLPVDGEAELVDAAAAADVPGLRLVDPAAAHPLLERLGARRADAATLLAEPALGEAVERSLDDAEAGLDVTGLRRLVLLLTAAAPAALDGPVGGGALALPDVAGEPRRADELVLPDGAVRAVLAADTPVGVLDPDVAAGADRAGWRALGVLDGFTVLHDPDPTGPDHDLDDEESWWAGQGDPAPEDAAPGSVEPGPLVAVRDLDLVDPGRWDAAWPLLAADRDVRAALETRPGGPVPYTAWWLARHALLAGRAPSMWRTPDSDDPALRALFDPVPASAAGTLDRAFLVAVGVRGDLVVRTDADAADLSARLADPGRAPDPAAVLAAHTALATAVAAGRVDPAATEPPAWVRTADGARRPADPESGPVPVVVDVPWLADVLPAAGVVPVAVDADALADLLDLPTARERFTATVASRGTGTPWSAVPVVAWWAARAGRDLPGGELVVHDRLRVDLADADATRTVHPGVWPDGGTWHADDPVRALFAAWAAPPG